MSADYIHEWHMCPSRAGIFEVHIPNEVRFVSIIPESPDDAIRIFLAGKSLSVKSDISCEEIQKRCNRSRLKQGRLTYA